MDSLHSQFGADENLNLIYHVRSGTDRESLFDNTVPWLDVNLRPDELRPLFGTGRIVETRDGGSTILYSSENDARFDISNGEEIIVDTQTADDEQLLSNLLGPLHRLVLLQRDVFVLHANVTQIGDRTAAFLASSGGGKSTITAGLYDRGHAVLADDAGAVELDAGLEVTPGPPVLKLTPESAAQVDREVEPVFTDGLESGKRFYHLLDAEQVEGATLDRIYLLDQADETDLQRVRQRDATIELVDNSWGLPDVDVDATEAHLERCSRLVSEVPVKRLSYPRSFDVFDDVLRAIERDCAYA